MQDRVGSEIPSEKEMEKLVAMVKEIHDALKKYVVHLTPEERRQLLKPRTGGAKVSEVVTRVAKARKLEVAGVSVEDIQADMLLSTRLAPLQAALASAAQTVDDTILEADSEAWWGTTAYYTALQGLARSDGALKTELQPATEFFALGRRKPKAAP
jgi:hypothetical protein